jgi:hypothetical protein
VGNTGAGVGVTGFAIGVAMALGFAALAAVDFARVA